MKTNELTGAALNLAVNHAEGLTGILSPVNYCGKWEHGGPIIEREAIQLTPDEYRGTWAAYTTNGGEPYDGTGPTPLIAAMRCYVVSKLGEEVDIPKELT